MSTIAVPVAGPLEDRYHRDGYRIFRDAVAAAEITAARNELELLIAEKSGTRPEWLSDPHKTHAYWLELCRHPRVIDAVRQTLGDDLVLIMSHLIVKPARDGQKISWHQDSPTWPHVSGTDITTAWLAIDRSDRGNGCMRVIPRSHDGHPALPLERSGPGEVFYFRVAVGAELEATQVAVELEAGDLSLHDSFIIHGSEANGSERRRAGYTMRYANSRTVTIDVARHWSPVFIVSGSGEGLARGYHDLRPGAPMPTLPLASPR